MNNNSQKVVLTVILIAIITLSLIASTYAFLRIGLSNANGFNASLKAGTMSLVFSDGNPGFNTQIAIGGSVEKIFTIENTGTSEAYATMSWRELQNTYTPGSLVYSFYESSDGGITYNRIIKDALVPTTSDNLVVADNLTVPKNKTMYYKLVISYVFLEDVNQTSDLRAYLTTLFTLEEGTFIDKAVMFSKSYDAYWGDLTYNSLIKTLNFNQGINVPSNTIITWDVSAAGDGRVMAYLIDSVKYPGYYDLNIEADTMQIYANSDSSSLFRRLTVLKEINNLEMLNTSNVTNMEYMFYYLLELETLDLSTFETSKVTTMDDMVANDLLLSDLNMTSFDTRNLTDMHRMFNLCQSLTELDLSSFDTSNVTKFRGTFWTLTSLEYLDISNFDTSSATTMEYMFSTNENLKQIDFSFDTSNVTNMASMFMGCSSLESVNIDNFDTSNVTNMGSMFYGCSSLTDLNLSSFNTPVLTTTYAMFYECSSLTDLNLSSFTTPVLTTTYAMFYNCTNLQNLNISNLDTSNVTRMDWMFSGCSSLESINIDNFDTSNVTNMTHMFYNCINLKNLNISNFVTTSVTDASYMFANCRALTTVAANNLVFPVVTNVKYMFTNAFYINITLTITSTQITDYEKAVASAASGTNARITINYSEASSSIVDSIIATKTSDSQKTYKGTLVSA